MTSFGKFFHTLSKKAQTVSPSKVDRCIKAALRLDCFCGVKAQILAIAGADYLNAQRNAVCEAGWHSSGWQSQQIDCNH